MNDVAQALLAKARESLNSARADFEAGRFVGAVVALLEQQES